MGLLKSLSLPYDTFLFRSCARPMKGSASRLLAVLVEEGLVARSMKAYAVTRRGLTALEQQELTA